MRMTTFYSYLKFLYYWFQLPALQSILGRAFEGDYGSFALPVYSSYAEIKTDLDRLPYRKDLYVNHISHPERVRYFIEHPEEASDSLDCDEFAIYICAAILRGQAHQAFRDVRRVSLLSVGYRKTDGEATGHNVCLIERRDGTCGYMDYDLPRFYDSIEKTVAAVVRQYAPGGVGLAWALSSPTTLFTYRVELFKD